MQIHELASLSTALASGTFFAVDNGSVTRKLDYGALVDALSTSMRQNNAGFRNSIFRGKNLGTTFTNEQSSAIGAGTFDDLFVGDYWTIDSIRWRIADFDTYYNCGDTTLNTHHIAVVPDTTLYNAAWDDTGSTSNGYVGSTIRTNIKAESAANAGAENKFIAAFGSSHVLPYRALYPATYTDGNAVDFSWVDARVELLSEVEAYGCPVWSMGGKGYEIGIGKRQLSLFRLAPQMLNIRSTWWLRNPASATVASNVRSFGNVYTTGVTNTTGVRPFALIA